MMGRLKWHRRLCRARGATMEVEFVVRRDDVMAYYEYMSHHSRGPAWGRITGRGWALVVCLGLLCALSLYLCIREDWPLSTILGPLVFLVPLLAMLLSLHLMRRQVVGHLLRGGLEKAADESGKLGWKRVTLTPEAVLAASENSSTAIAWAGVEKIVIAGEQALLFDSPTSALIIPRRTFADEEAFRAFVATAQRYRDAAGDGNS
jgi:hypothetical protein